MEAAFKECDLIRSDTFVNKRQDAAFLEPNGCIADYSPSGYLILHTSTRPSFIASPSTIVPTPRMADSGGLMIGVKEVTPYMPRLVTVKVPPAYSSGRRSPLAPFSARDSRGFREEARGRPRLCRNKPL